MEGAKSAEAKIQKQVQRALANEYVLEHIFGFLCVDDIKSCREVNRTWRNVGSPFLRRATEVRFNYPVDYGEKKLKEKTNHVMKYASSYVVDDSPRYSPFSSFYFARDIPVAVLANFMRRGRSVVTNLEIDGTVYSDSCEKVLELKRLISPNLKSITVHLASSAPFFCNLPPRVNFCLQELYLENCEVYLFEELDRLSLKKLFLGLKNAYFFKGQKMERFVVNYLFDFRATNLIYLHGSDLALDLGKNMNPTQNPYYREINREISLKDVHVTNWEECHWKVDEITLSGVPLLTKTRMEIENLRLLKTTADLSVLKKPAKLKELALFEGAKIQNTHFSFVNLNRITLEAKEACYALPLFINSRKLAILSLLNPNQPAYLNTMRMDPSFKSPNFPNVRKFHLHGAVFEDVQIFDQLVIYDGQLLDHDFFYHQGKFDYQSMTVDGRSVPRISPVQHLYVVSSRNEYMNRMMVGPFGWIRWRFQ